MDSGVRVKLYFHESFQDLVETILAYDEETRKYEVDFNKIKRMPDELNPDKALMGEDMRKGLSLFITEFERADYDSEKLKKNKERVVKKLKEHVETSLVPLTYGKVPLKDEDYSKILGEKDGKGEYQRLIKLGIEQAERIMEYRGVNWVDWRYRYWGTKYNAYDTDVEKGHIDFTVYERPCIEAVKNLSKQLPQILFAWPMVKKNSESRSA